MGSSKLILEGGCRDSTKWSSGDLQGFHKSPFLWKKPCETLKILVGIAESQWMWFCVKIDLELQSLVSGIRMVGCWKFCKVESLSQARSTNGWSISASEHHPLGPESMWQLLLCFLEGCLKGRRSYKFLFLKASSKKHLEVEGRWMGTICCCD